MDKALRPDRFNENPNTATAAKEFKHWIQTFEYYIEVLPQDGLDKLKILTNFVSPLVYDFISDCATYESAKETLRKKYVKPANEIFARHLLATRKQQPNETLDELLQSLKILSRDCNFRNIEAAVYRDEYIRDSFISGLISNTIRQRLLENTSSELQVIFNQARALEMAQKNSESYSVTPPFINAASGKANQQPSGKQGQTEKCYFCGNSRHSRIKCPAKDVNCNICSKKGHFAKVCQSKPQDLPNQQTVASMHFPFLAAITGQAPYSLRKLIQYLKINGYTVSTLIDSGSSESFIHPTVVNKLSIPITKCSGNVSMASASLKCEHLGYCYISFNLNNKQYNDFKVSVLNDLCVDLILGIDFQQQHESITFQFGGDKPNLNICNLATLNTNPPLLFENLPENCKPIATKSRRYSETDKKFIDSEIQRMLKEGIIEPTLMKKLTDV